MPVRLYKYLKPEHAEVLVQSGSVRVGTLSDFRSKEHTGDISDPGEGSVQFQSGLVNYDKLDIDHRLVFENRAPFLSIRAPGFVMKDCNIVHLSPDAYVFCTALKCCNQMWKDYRACVEIESPAKFRNALNQALLAQISVELIHGEFACSYDRHTVSIWDSAPTLPIRQKPERYRYQAEYRFAWMPKATQLSRLEAVFVSAPVLAKHCRLLTSTDHAALVAG